MSQVRSCRSLGVLVLMLLPLPSYADSDGAFCIGPDYLAFQLSVSVNQGNHRLYLMRFDDSKAWKNLAFVDLPYFSSPNFRCEPTATYMSSGAIHAVSWDASEHGDLSYRTMLRTLESESKGYPDTRSSFSLGIPGPYGATEFSLPSGDPDYAYELLVEKMRDPENECIRNARSLVRQKYKGEVVDSLELAATSLNAGCGE